MGLSKPIRKIRRGVRPGRLKGEALERLRMECWCRDGGNCRNCGRPTYYNGPIEANGTYHMAHIKAKRIGLDIIQNVRTLCGQCHRKEHAYGKSMQKPVPPKEKAA